MRCEAGSGREVISRALTMAMLLSVLVALLWAGPAAAGEKSVVERLLDILLANRQITEEQYRELLNEAKAEKQAEAERAAKAEGLRRSEADKETKAEGLPRPEAEKEKRAEKEAKPGELRAYWKNGLSVETEDRQFKIHVGGRTQVDFAHIEADEDLRDLAENEGDEIQGHGTEFRRARLQIDGTIYENVEFITEVDFGGGDVRFADVWIGLKDLPYAGHLRVGRMKEPLSIEELTGDNWSTFMERGLPNALAPSRNTGLLIGEDRLDHRMTWAAGVFEETDDAGEAFANFSDTQATVRISGLPWYEEKGTRLLHLGLGYSHQFRSPENNPVRFNSRPEAHLPGLATVDTGEIGADGVNLINPEAALVYGPFSLQAEYIHAFVDMPGRDADFKGWYAYVSYFITGEHRTYNTAWGVFDRIYPAENFNPFHPRKGGWGAWEAAFRYSRLDLTDSGAGVFGGKEDNYTIGLNWYLNPSVRFMFNYVRATIEDREDLSNEGTADIYESRVQVAF